jgi:hypothetical protein
MSQLILSNDLADNIMREFKERITNSKMYIMKGEIPASKEELDALTLLSDKQDDILISFDNVVLTQLDDTTIGLETGWSTANATATATWFWIRFNDEDETHACGSIGLIGSGNDMEIGNNNVSENGKYRITKLKFSIPMVW